MAKPKDTSDGRDVFDKALEDEYVLTPDQGIAALGVATIAGLLGGGALAGRFARNATRQAERAAMARAAKDGSLGWGKGRDAGIIAKRGARRRIGEVVGGTVGASGAVYAATMKKKNRKK